MHVQPQTRGMSRRWGQSRCRSGHVSRPPSVGLVLIAIAHAPMQKRARSGRPLLQDASLAPAAQWDALYPPPHLLFAPLQSCVPLHTLRLTPRLADRRTSASLPFPIELPSPSSRSSLALVSPSAAVCITPGGAVRFGSCVLCDTTASLLSCFCCYIIRGVSTLCAASPVFMLIRGTCATVA